MKRQKIIADFLKVAMPPESEKEAWYIAAESDIVAFLRRQFAMDHIPIFASFMPSLLLHGVLASNARLEPANFDDLQHCHVDTSSSWMIEHVSGGGKPDRMYLADPLRSTRRSTLRDGEKLIFIRPFYGMKGHTAPIEISQKLVHALNLHYLDDRSAYCRLDERGDIEDIIRIINTEIPGSTYVGKIVTICAK